MPMFPLPALRTTLINSFACELILSFLFSNSMPCLSSHQSHLPVSASRNSLQFKFSRACRRVNHLLLPFPSPLVQCLCKFLRGRPLSSTMTTPTKFGAQSFVIPPKYLPHLAYLSPLISPTTSSTRSSFSRMNPDLPPQNLRSYPRSSLKSQQSRGAMAVQPPSSALLLPYSSFSHTKTLGSTPQSAKNPL